jgi:hypothetical protein
MNTQPSSRVLQRLAVAIALLTLGALSTPSAFAALVGYWKLDEGSGQTFADSSGNGNSGVLGSTNGADTTDPTWSTGHIAGSGALSFSNGNNGVATVSDPGSSPLDVGSNAGTSDELTIGAWVNTAGAGYSPVVIKGPTLGGTNNAGNYELRLAGTTPQFVYETGGGAIANYSATSSTTTNAWHYFAVTLKEGGNVDFYIDGISAGSSGFGGTPAGSATVAGFGQTNNSPVLIGNRADNLLGGTQQIDHVTIFNTALTHQQIANIWSGSSPTNPNISSEIGSVDARTPGGSFGGRGIENLTNGSGLTNVTDNFVPEHNVNPGHMWMTSNTPSPTQTWVQFDLPGKQTLDQIRIWNYNEGQPARQTSTALIQTSADGITWTTLGGGLTTLDKATNAAGYETPMLLQLGGITARFVRFGNDANPLVRSAGDAEGYLGLSEVKFYGSAQADTQYSKLTNISAIAQNSFQDRTPDKLLDNSGLTGDLDGNGIQGHSNSTIGPSTMYLSAGGTLTPWIIFDLQTTQELTKMMVWNYNEFNETDRGIQAATLKYATSLTNPNDPNDAGWITFTTNLHFTQATGISGYEAFDEFYFPNISAKYFMIQTQSNWGDTGFTGLSEVQFFAVPEPTTFWMVFAGSLAFNLLFRRRSMGRRAALLGLLGVLFVTSAGGANVEAAPIIFDSFTGTNGDQLDPASSPNPQTLHSPDINIVPGAAYRNQNGSYNVALSNNTVGLGIDQGTGISIESAGAYVKPTNLTISADLRFGDVTGSDDYFTRTIALGFMNTLLQASPNIYLAAGFSNFQGLVIRPNGDLGLIKTYGPGGGLLETLSYVGTFNSSVFHSLSYDVNTITGSISNVVYDGTSYTFTAGLSTLTDANTKYAGFYVSGNGGSTAFVDNFMVVPEPTAFALLLVGLVGFVARRRFQG